MAASSQANQAGRSSRKPALGSPALLAMSNRSEAPSCLVEQAVNAALNQTFQDAEALLRARLGEVTLAMLSADLHNRLVARRGSQKKRRRTAP